VHVPNQRRGVDKQIFMAQQQVSSFPGCQAVVPRKGYGLFWAAFHAGGAKEAHAQIQRQLRFSAFVNDGLAF
jgi:hypothetical protein